MGLPLSLTALRNLVFDPRLYDRMPILVAQSFYRNDRFTGDVANMRLARTDGLSVNLNRTSAALCDPASVFRTRDAKFVSQYPQQRHLGNYINVALDSIQSESDHIDCLQRSAVILV
jgi:hypothetical protein